MSEKTDYTIEVFYQTFIQTIKTTVFAYYILQQENLHSTNNPYHFYQNTIKPYMRNMDNIKIEIEQ